MLLVSEFGSVYAPHGGTLLVGIVPSFYMLFADPLSVQAYLPSTGTPGPLTTNLLDPTTTPAGQFGGEVVALKLNVDFEDAGFLLGTSGIPFGNLVLTNLSICPQFDRLTVSQLLAVDNTALGGGSSTCSIANLDVLSANLNDAFLNGLPSTFAQTNLAQPTSGVPEPSSLLLLGAGLLGLAIVNILDSRKNRVTRYAFEQNLRQVGLPARSRPLTAALGL